MKQIILLMLAVFWGACFAEPDSLTEHGSESYQEVSLPAYHSDSVMFADSAAFYESLADRYKKEGENLLKGTSRQMILGGVLTLVGLGCLAVMKNHKNPSSLGGLGVMALSLGATTAGIVIFSTNGIRDGNGRRKMKMSEEYRKKAEEYRENAWKERYRRTSQMKIQIVPEIDPLNKTFGAKLALSI
ncbi:hypothetical protein [Fibrobacter sp.]|uniref:hypothetical protein n=1 Tax=Fibrobacter sp. TaxID=35828 RepID=UPI0025C4F584|nr:hypothetical protein [Fibrobacter sp.]MBR3071765.1 hypothetical protein [Fibrobacter sp.]